MKPLDPNLDILALPVPEREFILLNIVALRLMAGSPHPDYYYYILVDHADEHSLLYDKRLLLFKSLRSAKKVLALAPPVFQRFAPHPARLDVIIDIPKAIELAENETHDPNAYLLGLLNGFFDILECLGISLGEYQPPLWAFADHLTTDKDFGEFFQESGFMREEVCKGLYWLVGAVMSHTVIFQQN